MKCIAVECSPYGNEMRGSMNEMLHSSVVYIEHIECFIGMLISYKLTHGI